jgi:ferredoxin, 2Fe-2S
MSATDNPPATTGPVIAGASGTAATRELPPVKAARPTTLITVLPHAELCPQGASFDARQGQSLIDALLAHGLAIEHACDKVCACATCHVHVREGAQALVPADEAEEDQLDAAWGLDAQSRLACCVKLRGAAVTVELPRFTRNHAREG